MGDAACEIELDPAFSLGVFVTALDPSGRVRWTRVFGVEQQPAVVSSVVVAPDGALLVVGAFGSALHFPGEVRPPLREPSSTTNGRGSGFLMKLSP